MDPLSISSGIAGLASLAIQIAPAIHDYIATAKKAEEDISWYADEVDALIEVCVCLDNFLKDDAISRRNHFRTTDSVLGRTVSSCDACLRQLGNLLKVPVDWTQKLKWPFRKKTVEDIIRRLGRYTSLFQFSLTVEGHTVLSNTPKDVESLLKLQVEASQKLHEITKGIEALSSNAEKYRSTAENMSTMLEGIQSLTDASDQLSSIQRDVGTIKRQLTDAYDMEILEWLSPEHGRGRHSEVRSRRTPGTGTWLLDTSQFQNWLDKESSQRILWLVGDPGCGKSTLQSFVVDQLKETHIEEDFGIAYYYCDYRVQDTQPLTAALGGLLRLFLERQKIIPPMLRDTFERSKREGRKPLPSELKDILLSVTALHQRCFILIDAMDEFSISDTGSTPQFIQILDELAASGVNLLVTSRSSPNIPLKTNHIIKTIHANETDISNYVAHALHEDDSLLDILDTTLEKDIRETVVEQAKGMFLLAVLHLQNIRGQVTRSGVRKALRTLSGGLSEAYNKTFSCIQHQSSARQKLAFDSLMWVSASSRPLKSIELQHALATQPDDNPLDWDEDNIPSMRLVIRSCCGLLAVDDIESHESDVRLVHNTLHYYLFECREDWIVRANTLITRTCLTYLKFSSRPASADACLSSSASPAQSPDPASSSSLSSTSKPKTTSRRRSNPNPNPKQKLILTPFARDNWGIHAQNLQPSTYLTSALSILNNASLLSTLYPTKKRLTPLHIAATFGLTHLIKSILKSTPKPKSSIDSIESNSSTPLYKACQNNHLQAASLLLAYGAKPDPLVPSLTPLYISVSNNNIDLVKLLLQHGASVDTPCTDGWTALHKAADEGALDIVSLLVEYGAQMRVSSARGLTAIHRAAGRGHVHVVRYLLEKGAGVHFTSSDCWTPVHGAASAGRWEVVEFLIGYFEMQFAAQKGAKHGAGDDDSDEEEKRRRSSQPGGINFQTRSGKTALQLACQGAHIQTVQVLVSLGASLGIEDEDGDLALHIAAREGNAGIIKVLLKGLKKKERIRLLECRNLKGWTPLQEAQLSGIYEAEQILWRMSGGGSGDGDGEGDNDETARAVELIKAIREDDAEAASELLGLGLSERGDIKKDIEQMTLEEGPGLGLEVKNQGGRSPLQQALLFGSLNVAKMLLAAGASVHSRSDPGEWTAIHYAALSGNPSAITLCLSHGAEVNEQTQQKQTPLHHACRRGAEDATKLLLEKGADAEALDDRGWMPVHVAAAGGHERVVRFLLRYHDEVADSSKAARMINVTSIQVCAAQGGHHGLVELTRKWRYSWLT